MHFKTESFSYSKWIIVVEIGEIIHTLLIICQDNAL